MSVPRAFLPAALADALAYPFRRALQAWRFASHSAEFKEGSDALRASYPGTFVFGVIVGIAMIKAGLSPAQAIVLNFIAYSGTAQLAVLPIIASGGSIAIVWLTTGMLNARFVFYSAMMAPEFKRTPRALRLFMGLLSSDTSVASYLGWRRSDQGYRQRRRYYLGSVLTNWVYWHTGTILGVVAGGFLPQNKDVLLAATMAAFSLVGPMLVSGATAAAALAAVVVSIVGMGWPWRLNILAAIAAAVLAGKLVERLTPVRPQERR